MAALSGPFEVNICTIENKYYLYCHLLVVCNLENGILNYFFVGLMLEFYTRHSKEL